MVKTRERPQEAHYEHPTQVPRKPVGRPPSATGTATQVRCTPALLRACLAAMQAALTKPRLASTKNQLKEAVNGLTARLGPMAEPGWQPEQAARVRGIDHSYRIVNADGTEQRCAGLASAAAAYGCKPASLRVMLARGGGKCRKRSWHDGNESVITCEQLA